MQRLPPAFPPRLILAARLLLATPLALLAAAAAPAASAATSPAGRDFTVDHRYLHLPIKNGAPKRPVTFLVDGTPLETDEIELAESAPDWWAFLDVGAARGRKLTVQVEGLPPDSAALAALETSDTLKPANDLYREPLRPLIHFTARRGWINDPNGLVYFGGEYHLFYQHNPFGWSWGNMHWGHATSRDLVHWEEHGDVLSPDRFGPMFSGSAIVDRHNTSGFSADGHPPLVLLYTAAGKPAVQCLAFSTDGRNFTKYAGNPAIANLTAGNRDPKVFWHEPTQRWVTVLYTEAPAGAGVLDAKGHAAKVYLVQFLTSPKLREWTPAGTVAGGVGDDRFLYECPDFFELPVDGQPGVRKWVLSGGNGEYALGSFDGARFHAETAKLAANFGNSFYAAQTFSDTPDGRRIQIAWGRAPAPGMTFNHVQLLPTELRLRSTPGGPRLARTPVPELATLRDGPDQSQSLATFRAEALELRADFDSAASFELTIRGAKVAYSATTRELVVNDVRAPAPPVNGRQHLIVYVDRTTIEAFASDGLTYVSEPFIAKPEEQSVIVSSAAKPAALEVYKLKSLWPASK